jgi:hypothetical protein
MTELCPCAVLAAVCGMAISSFATAQCNPQWLPGEGYATSALNGNVAAMTVWDPDASGPSAPVLVVAGSFPRPGQTSVSVAAWNGTSWQVLGQCPVPGPVALAVYNEQVIAGGFGNGTTMPSIAAWNGVSWQTVGGDVHTGVRALWTHGTDLYAGGEFFTAGTSSVNKIARWDGQQWHDVGGGVTGAFFPMVLSLHSFQGDLIAGGFFDAAGGVPSPRIARWDGQQWHALGGGRPGAVEAMAVYNGELIAGGSFVNGDAVARWDGEAWRELGAGVDQTVRALIVCQNHLFAGGFFQNAGGLSASRIARWDGSSWIAMGAGITNTSFGGGYVDDLAVFNGEVISGGFFDHAGGLPSVNFARWTDSAAPWVSQHPASQIVPALGTLILTATPASGYSGFTFQWRRNSQALTNGSGGASPGGGSVAGASGTATGGASVTLSISGIQPSDVGAYDVVFSHPCGNTASNPSSITVTGGCYANCDGSATSPILTANDFLCFLTRFVSSDPYANCDGVGGLTANDFLCFVTAYAAGCP